MNQDAYIGQQIRRFRKEKKWSARELGEMIEPKKTDSAVTSWERGRTQPDGDTLIQLCRLFEVEISDFYYDPPVFNEKEPDDEVMLEELTPDERRLLSLYRQMTDDDKSTFIRNAQLFAFAGEAKKRADQRTTTGVNEAIKE